MVTHPRRRLEPALMVAVVLTVGASQATADAGRFWRSLVVPGWGQHSAGRSKTAARFLASEALLWAGYAGLRELSDIREQTYRTFAAAHADAHPEGKDGAYFDDLGFYASQHQHNQFSTVDDGPQAQLYPNTPEFSWEWDDDASRLRYRGLRNTAQSMERNALFVTGLVAVNHLVAAVHAARLDEGGIREPTGDGGGLGVSWQVTTERVGLALTRRF